MSYAATVYKVMIASPADVEAEREVIREVIHEWNDLHAESRGIVLMPVGWETHAAPELGDRAQAVITRQVLTGCDLLVATFWTRFGTPTGKAASGTAEEIAEHLREGGHVMLYFSTAPVPPDRVAGSKEASRQYQALKDFRASCQKEGEQTQGLYDTYADVSDFRRKFARHLELTVGRHFEGAGKAAKPVEEVRLTRLAISILLAAVKQKSPINFIKGDGGTAVVAGAEQFTCEFDQEKAAAIRGAMDRLVQSGCVQEDRSELYIVTELGFRVAREYRDSPEGRFMSLKAEMPELIAEMKADLSRDDGRLVREFFVMKSTNVLGGSEKHRFQYYTDKHDKLRVKLDLLEANGFLTDVSQSRTPIYRMSEEFVRLVLAHG